jgi:hypothetical protein
MFVTPLPLEFGDVVITGGGPRLPFCPFAFPVNAGFTLSVSRSAPSRCSRFSVRASGFLPILLDTSRREAGAIGVTKRDMGGHTAVIATQDAPGVQH